MSAELLARHRAVMPSWLALYYEQPIELVRGEGRYVWDADGRRYLDFFGGILTTMTGHSVPEVVDAIREQAGRLIHSSTLYLSSSMVELAERIAALAPVPDAKVFFTTSGTEANDTALLLATCARRSNQILALRNSYHGRSFSAIGVTGNRNWSATALSPFSVSYVMNATPYRNLFGPRSDADLISACVDDLLSVIETTTAGDVACLIVEPIQGVGGFTLPPDGFFAEVKKILDEHGILLIADEVQTGWGRTGDHFWGIQAHGVEPDMLTFAKGLGNGLSIGGVVARAELMDALPANSISTFGGNPLVCSGALANLDVLLRDDLQANARRVGRQLLDGLRVVAGEVDTIGDVRGKGLMIGVELVQPGTDMTDPGRAVSVQEACKQGGLLVGRGGLRGNVLRIAPPLSLTEAENAEGLAVLGEALRSA
jgi:4-aminobutyrate aminotransferase